MTTETQVAEWIRRGLALPDVVEDSGIYNADEDDGFHGCALFCCLAGKEGDAASASEVADYLSDDRDFADELDIPKDLAMAISDAHIDGVPASAIADCLANGQSLEELVKRCVAGYSEPAAVVDC